MAEYLNSEEDYALQGLSLEAQIIYLRGIKRFADKNGIAGEKHQISERFLAETIEFLPDRGSKLKPRYAKDITREYIRARLNELERARLIKSVGPMAFSCALATTEGQPQ